MSLVRSPSRFGTSASAMVTSSVSLTPTSRAPSSKSWAPTSQPTTSPVPPTPTRPSESNCHSSLWSSRISKSTSPSKSRSSTTRTSADALGQATTRAPPVWSPSFAQCPCVWTKAGTRFSSTWVISQGEPTERTTLKPYECRFMQTAESEESTSPTDFTLRMNSLQSSNSSSQLLEKPNNETLLNWLFSKVLYRPTLTAILFFLTDK